MAVTPVFGWPIPNLTDVADGPDGFSDLALAIENTLNDRTWLSYTPSWTSMGTVQPSNPGARVGRYKVTRGVCEVRIYLSFTGSSTGGTGQLQLGLPLPAQNLGTYPLMGLMSYARSAAGIRYLGFGGCGTDSKHNPTFPTSTTDVRMESWRNALEGNAPGNSIPDVGGDFFIRNGAFISVWGSYAV